MGSAIQIYPSQQPKGKEFKPGKQWWDSEGRTHITTHDLKDPPPRIGTLVAYMGRVTRRDLFGTWSGPVGTVVFSLGAGTDKRGRFGEEAQQHVNEIAYQNRS